MLLTIRDYFLYFIIYAVVGWCSEVLYAYIMKNKITNRGFLLGPLCPIYGFGALAVLILLKPYVNHPLGFFVLAMFVCSVIEYVAGYLMEKLFKARWWDYSNTKFNLNGRVCLDTLIPFGVGALIVNYLFHPNLVKLISMIPSRVVTIFVIAFAIIFVADLILSFNIVNGFKKTIKQVSLADRTDDINNYIKNLFANRSHFYRRLINAFPGLKAKTKVKKNDNDNKKD